MNTEKIAKIKLRIGRGESYTYWIYRPLAMATFLKIWEITTPFIVVVVAAFMGFLYLLGYADETILKIWQKENDYSIKHLNPRMQRLLKGR